MQLSPLPITSCRRLMVPAVSAAVALLFGTAAYGANQGVFVVLWSFMLVVDLFFFSARLLQIRRARRPVPAPYTCECGATHNSPQELVSCRAGHGA